MHCIRIIMPGNFKKEDLRITKTIKALRVALLTLLSSRNFSRITVHDLCEEAMISRATFYAHFYDKYDLLKYVLATLLDEIINDIEVCFDEMKINRIVQENSKIIRNTVEDADVEVLELLHTFMAVLLEAYLKKKSCAGKAISLNNVDYIVLSNFFSGGMVNLLQWQVKNKFSQDFNCVSTFLLGLLEYIIEWDMSRKYE